MSAKNGINKQCETCGKSFYIQKSKIERKRFCSRACHGKSKVKTLNANRPQPKANKGSFRPNTQTGPDNSRWVPSVQVICDWCGAMLERKPNELIDRTTGERKAHFYCNRSCFGQWKSHNWSGENGTTWRGGSTPYYGGNWKRQKRRARARDNHTCQKCGITEQELGKALDVHHIKRFGDFTNHEEANLLDNLTCLCHTCHMKVEYRKDHNISCKNDG